MGQRYGYLEIWDISIAAESGLNNSAGRGTMGGQQWRQIHGKEMPGKGVMGKEEEIV